MDRADQRCSILLTNKWLANFLFLGQGTAIYVMYADWEQSLDYKPKLFFFPGI